VEVARKTLQSVILVTPAATPHHARFSLAALSLHPIAISLLLLDHVLEESGLHGDETNESSWRNTCTGNSKLELGKSNPESLNWKLVYASLQLGDGFQALLVVESAGGRDHVDDERQTTRASWWPLGLKSTRSPKPRCLILLGDGAARHSSPINRPGYLG
jgi:hypothetical protein